MSDAPQRLVLDSQQEVDSPHVRCVHEWYRHPMPCLEVVISSVVATPTFDATWECRLCGHFKFVREP